MAEKTEPPKTSKTLKKPDAAAREARRAKALKANLRRRKAPPPSEGED